MQLLLNEVYKSVLKLLVPLTPEETYRLVIEEAQNLVGADTGSIFLAQGRDLKRIYSSSPEEEQFGPRKEGKVYQAFLTRKTLIFKPAEIKSVYPHVNQTPLKLIMLVPLYFNKKPMGVLALHSYQFQSLSKRKRQFLELFGSIVSITIRNSQLYHDMSSALQTKGLFLSMASHELKTPLTTISGYSQLLLRNIHENKSINHDWVQKINSQANRMKDLINELLVVNELRVGELRLDLELTSLSEVVDQAIAKTKEEFPDRKIKLINHLDKNDDEVLIDKSKMINVFINIFDNAIKFSTTSTDIVVSLNFKNETFIATIHDRGAGISKADLPHVTEEFFRGANNSYQGMGLGLYIAQRIIKAHNGELRISSKEGKGTKVVVKLSAF